MISKFIFLKKKTGVDESLFRGNLASRYAQLVNDPHGLWEHTNSLVLNLPRPACPRITEDQMWDAIVEIRRKINVDSSKTSGAEAQHEIGGLVVESELTDVDRTLSALVEK